MHTPSRLETQETEAVELGSKAAGPSEQVGFAAAGAVNCQQVPEEQQSEDARPPCTYVLPPHGRPEPERGRGGRSAIEGSTARQRKQ